eukprot:TRINITY_DN2100_c0_g1_i3.p1 TRINITY_DN2100_c0_g1~~TRINITY_DN2100_c0_g1_i3.p1  ORF type:complete len:290 (-),score=100.15 TRINITY_DN2100_c0_g1_i3:519-1388(-)
MVVTVPDVFRVIKGVTSIDTQIQQILYRQNPDADLSSRQAAMDFENALLSNVPLQSSLPQYAECAPLFAQRATLISSAPSTKLRTASVADISAAAELIERKEALERALEKRLVALEPQLAGGDGEQPMFSWQQTLEPDAALELPADLIARVPDYAELVPLAEQKRDVDVQLLATGFFSEEVVDVAEREVAVSGGKVRPRIKWWGISVEVPHAVLVSLLELASAASGVSGVASAFAGPQAKLLVTVLVAFVRVYSSVLEAMDRGNGVKFQIPWLAVYPLPQPLLIIPWPA